jgi:hypothetical protein
MIQLPMTLDRASTVNSLSTTELAEVFSFLKEKSFRRGDLRLPYVELTKHGWKCNLLPTRMPNGDPKYPQIDLSRFSTSWKKSLGKQLVHLIWWRATNGAALIQPGTHISHRHEDPSILSLVQESKEMNESRKYCHRFQWYKHQVNDDRPRCPHWDSPCEGNIT